MPQANPPTPLHIFKSGSHTAMSGQALEFSESDLQATVAAYDPAKHEAPLVVGHPQHDMPAYGWVAGLQFFETGSHPGLHATPKQVNPEFAEMVKQGAFKKISASFYAPNAPGNPVPGVYYLRHVGFLGAHAPAIKGLKTPELAHFSEDEEGVISFAITPTPMENPVTLEEKKALEEENARLRAQIEGQQRTQQHTAHVAFCETLMGQGRLLPAYQGVVLAALDHFAALPTPLEFGEGTERAPLVDGFKRLLQAVPPQVSFGETATTSRTGGAGGAGAGTGNVEFAAPHGFSIDPASQAMYQKARHWQAQHGGEFAAAVAAMNT